MGRKTLKSSKKASPRVDPPCARKDRIPSLATLSRNARAKWKPLNQNTTRLVLEMVDKVQKQVIQQSGLHHPKVLQKKFDELQLELKSNLEQVKAPPAQMPDYGDVEALLQTTEKRLEESLTMKDAIEDEVQSIEKEIAERESEKDQLQKQIEELQEDTQKTLQPHWSLAS